MSQDFSELIDWYKQFSSDLPPNKVLFPNAFEPATDREIREFQNRNDLKLPAQYVEFLKEVGFGRFMRGQDGVEHETLNMFLDFEEIEDRLDLESAHWNIDPDLFDKGDVPFFEYDEMSYFVFRSDDIERGSVWLSHKRLKISDTFVDFLSALKSDAAFYDNAIDEYFSQFLDDES